MVVKSYVSKHEYYQLLSSVHPENEPRVEFFKRKQEDCEEHEEL